MPRARRQRPETTSAPQSAPDLLALSERALRVELRRAEMIHQISEARYSAQVLEGIRNDQQRVKTLHEAWTPEFVREDSDGAWIMLSSGSKISTDSKDLTGIPGVVSDLRIVRRQSYLAWRLNPHARGVLRNVVKYTMGRGFQIDFQDTNRGQWADAAKTKIRVTSNERLKPGSRTGEIDKLVVQLIWNDFVKRNTWRARVKEMVLRTIRDGEVFVRRFPRTPTPGRIALRFIEPSHVQSIEQNGKWVDADGVRGSVGQEYDTIIRDGIEFLRDDIELVVRYHVKYPFAVESEKVDAKDILHIKCLADIADLRGIPMLEVVFQSLTNYQQWQEYRVVLNKVRTAVALVRKIEKGTTTEAANIIAGRLPARSAPEGRDPQTTSGRREAMFRAGTVLTPGPGVSYEFTSPRLEARDAGEDGRRILLSVGAGVGQPEMLVTSSWENANYSSSAAAIDAVLREWEDWQDFFEPHIEQIVEWVLSEAVNDLDGVPDDLDTSVVVQWPTIRQQDDEKSTNRREKLHQASVLSKRTWAAQEGLVYDDELENMEEDGENEMTDAVSNTRGESDRENDDDKIQEAHKALLALDELREEAEQGRISPALVDVLESTLRVAAVRVAESARA